MEFYQTEMGRQFFMDQLPKIVHALQDISESLEKKQTPVQLPVGVPENFLDELYHGNIEFGVTSYEGFHKEDLSSVTAAQNALQEALSEEQWDLFLEYNALAGEYASKEAGRMYKNGFRQAMRLIVAGLGSEGGNSVEA